MEFLQSLSPERYQEATLIVAGDVSHDIDIIRDTLSLLTRRFQHVFFTPGNHCAWLTPADTEQRGITHSAAKLRAVLSLCDELHVHTRPAVVAGLTVVPLLSWHHKSFDTEPDIPGIPAATRLTIMDYARCAWVMDEHASSGNTSSSTSAHLHHHRNNNVGGGSSGSAGVNQGGGGASSSGGCSDGSSDGSSSSATPPRQVFPSGDLGVAQMLDAWNEFPNPPLAGLRSSSTCGCTSGNGTSSSDGGGSDNGGGDGSSTRSDGSSSSSSSRSSSSGDGCSSPCCPNGHWSSVLKAAAGHPVLSFSHFLPRLELLPEKRFLMFPNLAKAVGSSPLNTRVQQLTAVASSHVHVFGHTHFAWDTTLDGVRYLQAPLCYPTERSRRLKSIVLQQDATRHVSDTHAPGSDALHDRTQPTQDAHVAGAPLQEEVTLLQSEQVDEAPPSQQQQQQRQQQQLHPQQQAAAAALPLQQPQQRPESTSSQLPWLPVLVYEGRCRGTDIHPQAPQSVVHAITATPAPPSTATPSLHSMAAHPSQGGDRLIHNGAHHTSSPRSPSQPAGLPACGCEGTGDKASQRRPLRRWCGGQPVSATQLQRASHPPLSLSAPTAQGSTSAASLPPTVGSQVEGQPDECWWEGAFLPPLQAMWSSHYESHPRSPEVLELAPWVAPLYARTQRMMTQRRQQQQQQGAPAAVV
ncbi:MAG: hypothetical protein WDW36_002056 [Sanguina aurantia]